MIRPRCLCIHCFLLFQILLLGGCDDPTRESCVSGEAGCTCNDDDDCGEGLTCTLNNVCVESSNADGDSGYAAPEDTDVDTGEAIELSLNTALVTEIYTADPSAHVFKNKLHVYVSHDLSNATDDYNMEDHHVLTLDGDGEFHTQEILHVRDVPWASEKMWAPDAAYKDGTYYFYFPAKDSSGIFRIGVATSDNPDGPFTAEPEPIPGSFSMDPAVFIDDDGTAYMYFGGLLGGQLECWQSGTYNAACAGPGFFEPALSPKGVLLTDDMMAFDGDVEDVTILDGNGDPVIVYDDQRRFFEAAWVHKHDDTYYLSYSTGTTHLIVYATADSPLGPFTYQGVVLPNLNKGWTTHHSITEFQGQWYLFYHDNSRSGDDHRRTVKMAELTHNPDGSIQTVRP